MKKSATQTLNFSVPGGGLSWRSLAAALSYHDPLNLRSDNESTDENSYEDSAKLMAQLLSRGSPIKEALFQTLSTRTDDEVVAQLDLKILINNLEWILRRDGPFQPRLFVDTGFKRTNESLCTLGYASNARYLNLPLDFFSLSDTGQQTLLRSTICEHMERTGGSLKVWGQIKGYVLVCPDGTVKRYGLDGVQRRSGRGNGQV